MNFFPDACKQIWASVLDFVYPPRCLECHSGLHDDEKLLCSPCAELLTLLEGDHRCSQCFNIESGERCAQCAGRSSFFDGVASALSYEGPAATLIHRYKYRGAVYLTKGIAAWMLAQWSQQGWPSPDVVIPVPLTWQHYFSRGYNQSALLAEEIAIGLGVPFLNALTCCSSGFSQAKLSRQDRLNKPLDQFSLERGVDLTDKTVLLIDDVLTTGSTLRCCAHALCEGTPAQLYALTFCKA